MSNKSAPIAVSPARHSLRTRFVYAFALSGLVAWCATMLPPPSDAASPRQPTAILDAKLKAAPDTALVRRLFPTVGEELWIERLEGAPHVWRVGGAQGVVGYVGSTFEIAGSVGYSGRPIDILVGVSLQATIAGAALVRHNEPILTLGISSEDISRYVSGFTGYDLTRPPIDAFKDSAGLPSIKAGATVSTGVIRDGILRTARAVALGRGLIAPHAGADIDRVTFSERTWSGLIADGSVRRLTTDVAEAGRLFGPIREPLPTASDADAFLDVYIAVVDPPTIGRNLLGQAAFTRAIGGNGLGEVSLLIASSGIHSHRGTIYLTSGVFDRIELIQADRTIRMRRENYQRVDRLSLTLIDAPKFKELSVFRIPAASGFRPTEPFRLEIAAERERADGSVATIRLPIAYTLPAEYVLTSGSSAEAPAEKPLWVQAWERKPLTIAAITVMIALVGLAMFAQETLVRRPAFWFWSRMAFLATTLVFLGWIAKGQLSVVQVIAFIQSLLTGFRWETFLIEPVIFILWGFVALGLLFWGRGIYCGWLCPFGALQELVNESAKRLGVRQIEVPFAVQERLWVVKYSLFLGLLGLSLYSTEQALLLAEVEPFKTAISMGFQRPWPFVVFVVGLLTAGLFIERFYCRYLCPLGAALAIPAKIKLFDWLHRRPQCGRECRFCETQCTVGAIDTLGRINPNECILCLRCQVIMNDDAQCVVLKRRAGRRLEPVGGSI